MLPGRDYLCYMHVVVTGNGTTWTSANTYSVSITTKEEKSISNFFETVKVCFLKLQYETNLLHSKKKAFFS